MGRFKKLGALASRVFSEKSRKNLERKLESTRIKLTAEELLGVSFVVAVAVAIGVLIVSMMLALWPLLFLSPFAAILTFLGLSMWLPALSAERRATDLDKMLPDTLRQMASTLRAGVGVDAALEDIASSRYGELSIEFQRVITEVNRGRSLNSALLALSRRSHSQLYKRAFNLIVEGIERGAALASVLDSVSNDIKEIQAVQRERRAATTQQVLFLFAVSLFAAPFIIGLTLGVSGIQLQGKSSGLGNEMFPVALAYTAIQAFICSLAVGVVRYGKMSRGIPYAIPFTVIATIVFFVAKLIVGLMAPATL